MSDPRPRRLAALVDGLTAAHLDGLLVTSLPNIRYLTGFSGSSALLFVSAARRRCSSPIFAIRRRSPTRSAISRASAIEPQSLWTGLWQQLAQTVGSSRSPASSRRICCIAIFSVCSKAGARWQWRPTVDLVETLRERKDAGELALIEAANGIATRALERTLPQVRVGMTELEVAGVLEKALRDEGSEGFPFPSIVASGPRSALPHARSSSAANRDRAIFCCSTSAPRRGVIAPTSRARSSSGRRAAEQREVYDVVRVGERNARRSGVRAGMTGRDADAIARDYIEQRGYGELFGHSLGHGLGLEVHEAPRLARTADGALAEGAVVTIEPGIYRPGWGGVRIEDDVFLGPDGPKILTSSRTS